MPRPPVTRVPFAIRFPEALAERLRSTATRERLSVNAAVEHAVFAWLEYTDAERAAIAMEPKAPRMRGARAAVPALPQSRRQVTPIPKKGAKVKP